MWAKTSKIGVKYPFQAIVTKLVWTKKWEKARNNGLTWGQLLKLTVIP